MPSVMQNAEARLPSQTCNLMGWRQTYLSKVLRVADAGKCWEEN